MLTTDLSTSEELAVAFTLWVAAVVLASCLASLFIYFYHREPKHEPPDAGGSPPGTAAPCHKSKGER